MGKGRRPTGFEDMNQRPGFRATDEQLEWLDSARIAAGETSLSDWLRILAADAGEKLLGKPFPRRKVAAPRVPQPRKKPR
jgi:hypothetical protein